MAGGITASIESTVGTGIDTVGFTTTTAAFAITAVFIIAAPSTAIAAGTSTAAFAITTASGIAGSTTASGTCIAAARIAST